MSRDAMLHRIPAGDSIVGFVIGRRGLMFNPSLEGSKVTRLAR